jgi:GT2 family glycosyltransferase
VPFELVIIVVNWNGGDLLRRCLASVEEFPPGLPYQVVVVDNASTDGSREWLESLGGVVRLLKNEENVGFGRANNRAFTETDAPILFLLNSDAEVKAGTLDTLLSTLRSEAQIGVVGPRLLNPDGSLQASVWQNPTTPFELLANAFRLYKLMPRRKRAERLLGYHWDHSYRRNAHLLSGAALMVKRAVIDGVGGFEERFHMYGEDTEWCLRVVRAGWRMVFEPDATVIHHGGGSTAKRWTSLEKRRAEYLAFFHFQRLSLSRRLMIGNLLSGWLASSAQVAWRFLRRQPREESRMAASLFATELKDVLMTKRKAG